MISLTEQFFKDPHTMRTSFVDRFVHIQYNHSRLPLSYNTINSCFCGIQAITTHFCDLCIKF